jgi:hypothetical protein
MNSDWMLIARGFFVAALGSGASMLYIVGLSAGYVGRFLLAGWSLGLALLLAVLFRRFLKYYLDALDQRIHAIDPISAAGTISQESEMNHS